MGRQARKRSGALPWSSDRRPRDEYPVATGRMAGACVVMRGGCLKFGGGPYSAPFPPIASHDSVAAFMAEAFAIGDAGGLPHALGTVACAKGISRPRQP